MKKTRHQITEELKHLRADIVQYFLDVDYWNEQVRKPGEDNIDPDPDGKLTALLKGVENCLRREVIKIL